MPAATRTPATTGRELLPITIRTALTVIAVHIMARAVATARGGIRAPGRTNAMKGLNRGIRSSRSSSHGQLRAKHHEATSRNTVVGSPGTTAPIAPRPTQRTPTATSSQRWRREVVGTGRLSVVTIMGHSSRGASRRDALTLRGHTMPGARAVSLPAASLLTPTTHDPVIMPRAVCERARTSWTRESPRPALDSRIDRLPGPGSRDSAPRESPVPEGLAEAPAETQTRSRGR